MGFRIQCIRTLTVVVLATVVMASVPAFAQDPLPPVVNLPLKFADPGARSMGLGGAFVGLADDATAAFANPAGLVQLGRPEISIEGRSTSYSTPFTEGGRVEGEPSGFGIDNTFGLRSAQSENVVTDLSFLSLAYPKGGWSIAFYRQQLANFEFFGETQGIFGGGTECCQRRFFDQRTSNDFDFVNYGLSGAYRVGDSLSLGLGVTYLDAALTGITDSYSVDDDTIPAAFRPNSYLVERWVARNVISIEDSDWVLTGGFLWTLTPSWRVGGVYRQGPELEIGSVFIAGRLFDFGVPPGEVFLAAPRTSVELPSVLGLGFSYRAADERLTVSLQWDHIGYSSVSDSLDLDELAVDDANELHLGGEFVFHHSTALIAIRGGAWLDPDHQLGATTQDPVLRALKPSGTDEMHYAAGVGVALKHFQIDLGVDLSARVDTVSISAIYSF